MRGILTFWRQSKIFKTIAVILPLPLLLVALLLSPVRVFAASGERDYNSFELTVSDNGINANGVLTATALVNDEYSQIYTFRRQEEPNLAPHVTDYINVLYEGTVSVSHSYQFQTIYNDGMVYHDAYVIGWISDNASISITNAGLNVPSLTNASIMRMSVDNIDTSINFNGNTSPRIGNTSTNTAIVWDIADFESDFISAGTIRHNYNVKLSVIVHYETQSDLSYEDLDKLAVAYITPTVTSSYAAPVVYGSFYNAREIMEGLDTKLYNIWTNTNLLYNALTAADTNNRNMLAQVIAAINQLDLSNSADVQRIIDLMVNNSSGVAEDSDTVKANLATADAAAEDAIDNAVHDYDSEFQQIKDFNEQEFFHSQTQAVNFWRSIGEYILDSNNIGFFATGLIICTLVTVFVFLLRL